MNNKKVPAGEIIMHQIIKENNNEIDAKVLTVMIDERLILIQKEIDKNNINQAPNENCSICGGKLEDKKITTRRVHDIIYHFGEYCSQMNIKKGNYNN